VHRKWSTGQIHIIYAGVCPRIVCQVVLGSGSNGFIFVYDFFICIRTYICICECNIHLFNCKKMQSIKPQFLQKELQFYSSLKQSNLQWHLPIMSFLGPLQSLIYQDSTRTHLFLFYLFWVKQSAH
jgi:hypothetical protein